MKKTFRNLVTFALASGLALSCSACGGTDENTIVVGATSAPHAEILECVRGDLEREGYRLEIVVYDDYAQLNPALADGDIDANYFQHTPYLDDYNAQNGQDLVAAAKIHYEPLGLYGKGISKADYEAGFEKTGRTILIPDDTTNGTRALLLLQQEGFLVLPEGASPRDSLSVLDIVESNGNRVVEVAAAQVPSQLLGGGEGFLAVVNGNYALAGGLDASGALAYESAQGGAAQLYANIVAVRRGDETLEKIVALVAALRTQKVIDFINETYRGAVQAVFTG